MKSGLRVLGAQAASPHWHVTVDINPKQTIATVTAFRKEEDAAPLPRDTGVESSATPHAESDAENER